MTPEQEKKISTRATTLFPDLFPDAWKHHLAGDTSYDTKVKCGRCKKLLYHRDGPMDGWWQDEFKTPCTIPTPLDINWDNAMRMFREVDKHWGKKALVKIFVESKSNVGFGWWLMYFVTPADYILAACIAKEKEVE